MSTDIAPTAEHIAEAHRVAPIDCPVSAITRIAYAIAAAEDRGRSEERVLLAPVIAAARRCGHAHHDAPDRSLPGDVDPALAALSSAVSRFDKEPR